jgi:3',5'-nucleoside bisphosphate phosphatase
MDDISCDLHCHSTFSDGSLDPEELFALAIELGLQGISITDHDTLDAYHHLPQSDLMVLPGIELSALMNDISIHVLGYAFDIQHPQIVDFCRRLHDVRNERNGQILEKLRSWGLPLDVKALKEQEEKEGSFGRVHIAREMVKKGYVRSIQEAFGRYIGDGKCCFVRGEKFSVEEAIDIIHKSSGFAVIAHPHLLPSIKIVKMLLELEFDGIECLYGNFHPKQCERYVSLAVEHHLLITGGSDFHGEARPGVALGASCAPPSSFFILWQRYLENTKRAAK